MKVTVPVGLCPAETVAVSLIWPPTMTGAEAWVAIVGLTFVTVDVSPSSLQAPALRAFLLSPLYVAIHRYVPAVSGVKVAGPYVPSPLTANGALVNAAVPEQFGLAGP